MHFSWYSSARQQRERERVASFKGAFFASTQVATWELKAVLRVFRLDGAAVLRPNGPFLAH